MSRHAVVTTEPTADLIDFWIFIQSGDHHQQSAIGDALFTAFKERVESLLGEGVHATLNDIHITATNVRNAGSHYCEAARELLAGFGFQQHSTVNGAIKLPRGYRAPRFV